MLREVEGAARAIGRIERMKVRCIVTSGLIDEMEDSVKMITQYENLE